MQRFVPDTNCIIAALSAWHVHHEQSLRDIERRLDASDSLVVAAPTLVEAYAVLTRFPPPHRLTPSAATTLLKSSFGSGELEIAALPSSDYLRLLDRFATGGITGGRAYDVVILACALAARADVLLTFNARHFRPLAPDSIEIVVPR